MSRLIEVDHVEVLPSRLTLRVGDVLQLAASGAESGAPEIIQVLGPFVPAVLGPAGQVVSPAGPPNAVLLLAQRPGRVDLLVVSGDPWNGSPIVTHAVTVEP